MRRPPPSCEPSLSEDSEAIPDGLFRRGFKLRVGGVPLRVPGGLLLEVALESLTEIHPGLVRETDQHEQHIGKLITELEPLLAALEALVSMSAGEDSGHLAHLLDQLGKIRQLREIAYADLLDPTIDTDLGIGKADPPRGFLALLNRITQ